VLASGAVVVLRAVSGISRWRRCKGEEERATSLVKKMW
jgi:hypothetical protein